MEILKVTKDIVIRAILFGACKTPAVGTPVSVFSSDELSWAECLFTQKEMNVFERPLWTLSGYGSGDGSGRDICKKILAIEGSK